MTQEPPIHLTTKDHAILQTMLERYAGPLDPYAVLLRRKLRHSSIHFRDDIPPEIVTINTRLTYRVDGTHAGPHLLVQFQAADLPSFALSVHTLRGLALLGLAEGASTTVALGSGKAETLQVERILAQPEALARRNVFPTEAGPHDPGPGAA